MADASADSAEKGRVDRHELLGARTAKSRDTTLRSVVSPLLVARRCVEEAVRALDRSVKPHQQRPSEHQSTEDHRDRGHERHIVVVAAPLSRVSGAAGLGDARGDRQQGNQADAHGEGNRGFPNETASVVVAVCERHQYEQADRHGHARGENVSEELAEGHHRSQAKGGPSAHRPLGSPPAAV